MPKNNSKHQSAKAAPGSADDDFDRMLAEVTAEDSQLPADVSTSTSTTANVASSSSSSSGGGSGASLPGMHVSEDAIAGACKRGDINQLRRWGRRGVRVSSAMPLIEFVFRGMSLDILRCLVKDLGADINGARLEDEAPPLAIAAQIGNLSVLQCLVKELGADVNKTWLDGITPLSVAAQNGHFAVVRCLVEEFGADFSQAAVNGATSLFIGA
jgi:hypothetical protein